MLDIAWLCLIALTIFVGWAHIRAVLRSAKRWQPILDEPWACSRCGARFRFGKARATSNGPACPSCREVSGMARDLETVGP